MGAGKAVGPDGAVSTPVPDGVESRAERAVLRVYTRVLLDLYARGALERGLERGQTGMVTALQRAGGANRRERIRMEPLIQHTLSFLTPPPQGR